MPTPEPIPPIRPSAPWRVKEVQPLDGFRLPVVFADHLCGEVYLAGLVHFPKAGVFASLADPKMFAKVSLQYGAVVWPGEIDLAPDAMHAAIQEAGVWVL